MAYFGAGTPINPNQVHGPGFVPGAQPFPGTGQPHANMNMYPGHDQMNVPVQHESMYHGSPGQYGHYPPQQYGNAGVTYGNSQMPPPLQVGPPYSSNELQPDISGYGSHPSSFQPREEPTRILRRPFESTQESNKEIYDPSYPTSAGPTAPSSSFSYGLGQNQMTHMQHNNSGFTTAYPGSIPATPVPTPQPSHFSTSVSTSGIAGIVESPKLNLVNSLPQTENRFEKQNTSKVRVMTGLVTQIQPGGFGMISEEIFFQQSAVTGEMPKVGDKVVVEAEPVNGMPFKYNAKRVTQLDMDLVNEEKDTHKPFEYKQPPMDQTFQRGHLGPLPSLPESLNLPKPGSPTLKSILKTKESPALKRNPPPPPIISKSGVNKLREELKASKSKSSYKLPAFEDNQNKAWQQKLVQPESTGSQDFEEYTFVNHKTLNLVPKEKSPEGFRACPPIWELKNSKSYEPQLNMRKKSVSPHRSIDRNRDRESQQHGYKSHQGTGDKSSSSSPDFLRSHIPSSSSKHRRSRRSRSTTPVHHRNSKRSSSRSLSKSPSPQYKKHDHNSGSFSPRRSHKVKERSITPHRRRSRSISPRRRSRSKTHRTNSRSSSPRTGRNSRSSSPGNRNRSRSVSRQKSKQSRNRSRSITPSRRKVSRSVSRDRRTRSRSATPPKNRRRRSRSGDKWVGQGYSQETRKNASKRRSSSSSVRSVTPPRSREQTETNRTTVVHGIVMKTGVSNLFPAKVGKNASRGPIPVKFQITNPAASRPTLGPSLVPNPKFTPPALTNNNTKTVNVNRSSDSLEDTTADGRGKKKKSKEQEPAFRVISNNSNLTKPVENSKPAPVAPKFPKIEEKMKQWEAERNATKQIGGKQNSEDQTKKNNASENVSKNPVDILQIKQTVLNDLKELRNKGHSNVGKTLLSNAINIEELKQTVQRDLSSLKDNTINPAKPPPKQEVTLIKSINIADLKVTVQQGLQELRSKFDKTVSENNKNTVDSQKAQGQQHQEAPSKPSQACFSKEGDKVKPAGQEKRRSISPMTKRRRVRSPPMVRHEAQLQVNVDHDEELERLQEQIHAQRFEEEQHRLRAMGDEVGLQQLYFMEDRRRRRLDERHLARLRLREIQLKKDKNFPELNRLRQEWGPPHERMEQERLLRNRRLEEERHDAQFSDQAEAIRRHEVEYQSWLEEEATARMRESERLNRGCEGRVKRRRTPSPPAPGPSSGHSRGPPQLHRRRRSRSASFERYREDWRRDRKFGNRSPELDYVNFVARYRKGPPPPTHHFEGHFDGPLPHGLDEDQFIIARAMDDASRRQEEIFHREMEIRHRMEMAERHFTGPHHDPRMRDTNHRDYGRFPVPRH